MARDSLLVRRHLASSRVHIDGYENPPDYEPVSFLAHQFDIYVRKTSFANLLDHRVTERGFEMHLLPGALFEEGTDRFKPQAAQILALIGRACKYLPHPMRVEAYPDVFFVRQEGIGSPEELALRRAAAVCGSLRAESDIAASRLSLGAAVQASDAFLANAGKRQVTIVVLKPRGVERTL